MVIPAENHQKTETYISGPSICNLFSKFLKRKDQGEEDPQGEKKKKNNNKMNRKKKKQQHQKN